MLVQLLDSVYRWQKVDRLTSADASFGLLKRGNPSLRVYPFQFGSKGTQNKDHHLISGSETIL